MRVVLPKEGERFGSLITTGKHELRYGGVIYLETICLCGRKKWIYRISLLTGMNIICGAGCLSPLRKMRIMKGERYAHLVATGKFFLDRSGFTIYEFECDCGRLAFHGSDHVIKGTSKSCCHIDCKLSTNEHHGKSNHPSGEKYKNGMPKTSKEYSAWGTAKSSCYSKNHIGYKNTGGKGIIMCDEWKNSFIQFHKDMGDAPSPRHMFSRRDTSGDFEPENCYWKAPKGWKE